MLVGTFVGLLAAHPVIGRVPAAAEIEDLLAARGFTCTTIPVDGESYSRRECSTGDFSDVGSLYATYDLDGPYSMDGSDPSLTVGGYVIGRGPLGGELADTMLDLAMLACAGSRSDIQDFLQGIPLDDNVPIEWSDEGCELTGNGGFYNDFLDATSVSLYIYPREPRGPTASESTGPSAEPSASPAPSQSAEPSASPVPSQSVEEPPLAGPVDPGAGGNGQAPRSFASAIAGPADVSTDLGVLLQSAAFAALFVFLMPFPSQLFNSTLETHETEVRRWFRLDRIGSAVGRIGAFWTSWPGVALFTMLAAALYGFLDPGFGLNAGSLPTFMGMLVGIVLTTTAFTIPVVLAHRRHGDRPGLKVVPVSLLIGVGCVLLSRLTDFQPGYLYGLLLGLAFARELSADEEGRTTALSAAAMLVVALVAWIGLGALPDGDGFGLVAARTTLAVLMVAGLEGVVFGLLPMRFLPGASLYAWNRILWSGLLALGVFAFFHILINPASGYLSDTSRTPLFTVVALLVGFSVVSVAFWSWFRFRPSTTEPHSPA